MDLETERCVLAVEGTTEKARRVQFQTEYLVVVFNRLKNRKNCLASAKYKRELWGVGNGQSAKSVSVEIYCS